jgi:predicted RNase H-like HicB family nuclease
MAASLSFTAIYEPVENGWVQARIRELPPVITCAPTRAEAEDMLLDAVREYLLSLAVETEDLENEGERVPLEITFR